MASPQRKSSKEARHPAALRFLLSSTLVSVTGDGLVIAATPLLAASLTRSPLAVSAVTAVGYASWILMGLPAGALVDRWSRRAVMITADLGRAVILVVLTALIFTGHANLPILAAAVFLVGVGSCFFDPAAQSLIPLVAGRANDKVLAGANGKFWAFDTFGRSLAGPPLGSSAFTVAPALPFGLDGISFVISALLLRSLPGGKPKSGGRESVLRSIRSGLRFILTNPGVRLVTLCTGAYNFGYNIAFGPLVLFVQEILHLGDIGYGVLVSMMALGGIVGGWVGPRSTGVSVRITCALTLLVQGLSWSAVWLTGNALISAVALACLGVASTTVSVAMSSARQMLTPDALLGRVFSASRLLNLGTAAAGAIVGGAIARAAGVSAPLVIAAGLLLVFSAIFALVGCRVSGLSSSVQDASIVELSPVDSTENDA